MAVLPPPAVFEVGQPDIAGFGQTDMVLNLDTGAKGSLTWLIVPTEKSASVQQGAKQFFVGGSLLCAGLPSLHPAPAHVASPRRPCLRCSYAYEATSRACSGSTWHPHRAPDERKYESFQWGDAR